MEVRLEGKEGRKDGKDEKEREGWKEVRMQG